MLSPSEGQEIYERVIAELEGGRDMTPEDVAHLMQAAESGYAPAQNAYANVLNNVEGNLLAALPWYCKASQAGHAEAQTTLRELYATETLVREQVSKYLTVQELIDLRKPRKDDAGEEASEKHSLLAQGIAIAAFCIAVFLLESTPAQVGVVFAGALLAAGAEAYYQRNR